MQVFVIINNIGTKIDVDVNVKNWFAKKYVTSDYLEYPSSCECVCDKPCDVRECLDYENYKCRKKLVDKLVEECGENIDENEVISITLNDYESVCNSCTI